MVGFTLGVTQEDPLTSTLCPYASLEEHPALNSRAYLRKGFAQGLCPCPTGNTHPACYLQEGQGVLGGHVFPGLLRTHKVLVKKWV